MPDQPRAGDDGYRECHIYARHGACSCSTGVPGNVCPLAEPRAEGRLVRVGQIGVKNFHDGSPKTFWLVCEDGMAYHFDDDLAVYVEVPDAD